jgi:hypothetical protein
MSHVYSPYFHVLGIVEMENGIHGFGTNGKTELTENGTNRKQNYYNKKWN